MKLLIVCQVVDRNHPVLGFFHRWIEEFAKHAEHIHVIALQTGEYALPKNVAVHSLGKERGANLFQKLFTFYALIFRFRKEYDAVFVHMNPEYIVLAGWWWRLVGKKVALWYNHSVGSLWLRIAYPFTCSVFHTSPFAHTARYGNAVRMSAGIDTDVFKPLPDVKRKPQSIYFQGRIAPAKNVHILLEAFALLHSDGVVRELTMVGPEERTYTDPLKRRYASLIEAGAVSFYGPVANSETPPLFASHTLSVNLTADGNYDKSVLESMACGTPCVVASSAFDDLVDPVYKIPKLDITVVAETLRRGLDRTAEPGAMYERVRSHHSLSRLGEAVSEWLYGDR